MMRLLPKLSQLGSRRRYLAFAAKYFAACHAHTEHAQAVHAGLEQLLGRRIEQLDPDALVSEILDRGGAGSTRGHGADNDFLDAIELKLALEEELTPPEQAGRALAQASEQVKRALAQALAERTLKALLGAAARHTTWDAATIRHRSVRGIINERVRYAAGCTCAERGAPSNDEMHLTSAAQATNARR